MVGNKKNMEQITNDLVDFIGEEAAEQFVAWLSQLLPTFETQSAANVPVEDPPATEVSQLQDEEIPVQKEQQKEAPSKRVISLKGLSSSSEPPKKKVVSLSGSRGTIRSLNPSKTDMDDVIARRAQRFGVMEKKPAAKKSPSSGKEDRHQRDESRATGNKRRANERDGDKDTSSRLSQRLGPPVNVDQAQLDARDTLGSHKKRRGDRDHRDENQRNGGRANRRNDRDRDHDMEDAGHNGNRRSSGSRDAAPPLPPSDEKGDFKGKQGYGQGMGPPMGFQGGPMGYGGFPPPYGGPMFYPPPGYGPMNPYAMGFPPQGMPPYGGRGYPRGMQNGPRGARPFQNRKWVNPNVAKAEEEAKAAEGNPEPDATENDANSTPQNSGMNPGAPAFASRNPYFSSQMRPRFQNKTWVRQDPAKDEELNSSLPKTPPKELLESTD
ncbi:hypothetical protein V7S43_017044 [Phytophthora oleae]